MTDKNTVFTLEGAKTFADTYCKSCDAENGPKNECVGETADTCHAFKKTRIIRMEIAIAKEGIDDLFKLLNERSNKKFDRSGVDNLLESMKREFLFPEEIGT